MAEQQSTRADTPPGGRVGRDIGFAQLLAKLYGPDEVISIWAGAGSQRRCVARTYVRLAPQVISPPEASRRGYADANCWYGVNPIDPVTRNIARLAVLTPEFDYAECGGEEVATEAVGDLTRVLGPPAAITLTDRGLQPYWPITDGTIGADFTRDDAQELLDRLGLLVTTVADRHEATVDTVFDLGAVTRVPGTGLPSGQVTCCEVEGAGAPLTVAQLTAILEQQGIQLDDDPEGDSGHTTAERHVRLRAAALALRMFLGGGPWAQDVEAAAAEAGLTRYALKAAKKDLHVMSRRAGVPGRWYWVLPKHDGQLPPDAGPGQEVDSRARGRQSADVDPSASSQGSADFVSTPWDSIPGNSSTCWNEEHRSVAPRQTSDAANGEQTELELWADGFFDRQLPPDGPIRGITNGHDVDEGGSR